MPATLDTQVTVTLRRGQVWRSDDEADVAIVTSVHGEIIDASGFIFGGQGDLSVTRDSFLIDFPVFVYEVKL
jgi:hypothetical protein